MKQTQWIAIVKDGDLAGAKQYPVTMAGATVRVHGRPIVNSRYCEAHALIETRYEHPDKKQQQRMWRASYSEEYLPQPEDSAIGARYRMLDLAGRPLGRLYVEVRPAYRVSDSKPIFVMNLTARGAPRPVSNERMFQLLDLQHEWIVRGFAAITTPSMHRVWGRTDG